MSLAELVHLVERSFVWHAVGDLVRGFDPLWLLAGVVLLGVGALAVRLVRNLSSGASGRVSSTAAPALQRTSSTVHCQCGRVWTVRS